MSKCQTRRVGLAVCARVRQPHSRPGSLGAPLWATGLQADGRRPSNRHRVSPEPTGASTRSLGALLGPMHPPPQCSRGHEGATSCPEPAPLMSGTSAQAPSPQTVRGVAPKREGRGRGGAPVRPPISCASLSSPPGLGPAGVGPPTQAQGAPGPRDAGTPVFAADFRTFADTFPDFAEEYLYPDRPPLESLTQPPPTATPNGFCADFSPEASDTGGQQARQKLD